MNFVSIFSVLLAMAAIGNMFFMINFYCIPSYTTLIVIKSIVGASTVI